MAGITIVLDPDERWGHSADEHVIGIRTQQDVVTARRALQEYGVSGKPIVIQVINQALLVRFDDLRDQEQVDFLKIEERTLLARLIGLPPNALPPFMTAAVISDLKLTSHIQAKPPELNEEPAVWALRVAIGRVWTQQRIGGSDILAALCELSEQKETNGLRELLQWRLRKLAEADDWRELLNWLVAAPVRRARCFIAAWTSRHYGDAAVLWLQDEEYARDEIKQARNLCADDALAKPMQLSCAYALSQEFQKQLAAGIADSFAERGVQALEMVRAYTSAELHAVAELLQERAESGQLLGDGDAEIIQEWLRPCRSSRQVARISRLSALLRYEKTVVNFPTSEDWRTMRTWLTRDYMPSYRAHAVAGNIHDLTTVTADYEAWFVRHYSELHMASEAGLRHFSDDVAERLEYSAVLIVLLDGVPYPALKYLNDTVGCSDNVRQVREAIHVSLAPSTTPLNKAALLQSCMPDGAHAEVSEEHIASLLQIGEDRVELSVTDSSDLIQADKLGAGHIYVIHYRSVDATCLHQPMASWQRWEKCYRLLDEVAASICQIMVRCDERGLITWIGCVSDHGWTELPRDEEWVALPVDLADRVHHGRVINGVADARYGWPLDATGWLLDEDCTVARGYTHFSSRPHGAVHGGITPQETVVLGTWFSNYAADAFEDLVATVSGEVKRGHGDEPISVKIVNPNTETITVNALSFAQMRFSDEALPMQIRPVSTIVLSGWADASRVRETLLRICGEIHWECGGRQKRQTIEVVILTKGAASSVTSFDNMFGD